MSIYAPIIKHIVKRGDVYIERVLPVAGHITASKGQRLEPYSPVGECSFSQNILKLPLNFKTKNNKLAHKFYYDGMVIGKSGSKKIQAPFNGHLIRNDDNTYEFAQLESKYVLLSGVWGEVFDTVKSNSALIKTQTNDLLFAAATKSFFSGELIVFPNPSELLEKHYLGKYASGSTEGKIVYVGNFLNLSLLKEAEMLGWGAVIAGSTNRDTYDYARTHGICLGVFTGFGHSVTPSEVFTYLNNVTNRYVFFDGTRGVLRIPMPFEEQEISKLQVKKNSIVQVAKGMSVFCLQKPYFGHVGIVDSLSEFSILVRFQVNSLPVEVKLPNFYILE